MTRIEIDPAPFIWSHGEKPRGRDSWAFSENPDAYGSEPDIIWTPSMTYREARVYAKAKARERERDRDYPRDIVVLYALP